MINRRNFLKSTGILTAALLVPARSVLASKNRLSDTKFSHLRIKGKVRSNGMAIQDVVVTDGVNVTSTNGNGEYFLESSSLENFIYISIPSGFGIPKSEKGTANFYHKIPITDKNDLELNFTLEKLETDDNNHVFFALADPQILDNDDAKRFSSETIPDLKTIKESFNSQDMFGISVGDIMFDNLDLYNEYENSIKATDIPFFQVLGNHDVITSTKTDEASTKTFENHFGPTYYSFNRGKIHYIVLDNIFWFGSYIGYLSQKQLDWLEKDLSFVSKDKTVVLFMHIPSFTYQHIRHDESKPSNSVIVTNRKLLYDILKPYKTYLISGHTHENEYIVEDGNEIHVVGAACGAWWSGDICFDGSPNGYAIYEVKGNELKWTYKGTGMDITDQIRVYPAKTELNPTDEIVVNIWASTDKWKVTLLEDGNINKTLERRKGKDPLSIKLHEGKDKPTKHSWVEPIVTEHLYFAKQSENIKDIVVVAEDIWGRKFQKQITV